MKLAVWFSFTHLKWLAGDASDRYMDVQGGAALPRRSRMCLYSLDKRDKVFDQYQRNLALEKGKLDRLNNRLASY